jgi:hypothetical protein
VRGEEHGRAGVGEARDDPGLGAMAAMIRQITGAADETGFAGFGGFGSRE